ncbi:hypothetical protein Pla110_36530 [Polystyrenella longa]|uniref:Uncharacterized protein n=1 Tax=Polystyrenella longa TaxID=2528007 RepID=A0A518CRP7_9PLAN|nr:hypothetical protein [Polystyrenella longa]QDU81902.1 hypothetical protein Pla110_36530 [Polystyrenella longa]
MELTPEKLNRRDFSQLTMAAMGGLLAGTAAGCGTGESAPATTETAEAHDEHEEHDDDHDHDHDVEAAEGGIPEDWKEIITSGKNVCRGLNQCKNHREEANDCAGTGACYTANKHTCHADNDCKGQGGCGSTSGRNSCKGKGECSVPLNDKIWATTRTAFEEAMKAAGKEFGEAPAKVES